MAGHSQFKNIMHRKNIQDAKRAKLFSRLIREISVCAKEKNESALKSAIENAKKHNVPKKNIDNAISSNENIGDLIRYEGFINGIGIIIETITDNKNRTAASIRSAFNKFSGNMSSTLHLFKIMYEKEFVGTEDEVIKYAIENEFDQYKNIEENKWILQSYNSSMGEKSFVSINKPVVKCTKIIEDFLEHTIKIDEVQNIWTQLE